ncbi:MAG TPA: hypothetical protein VMG11_10595 [Steroidobacteraceae bacterium]|nr:hypothetical protein [Steroidobacteraceae bacterium]
MEQASALVMRLDAAPRLGLTALLSRYGLELVLLAPQELIPGSYWGASEAGLIGARLYARLDTPVHSVLHETAHFICMSPERRVGLERDAGGDDLEECAVCYLQILLARVLPEVGSERLCADMDAWGYSFRLGSTRTWFEGDAEDARNWLLRADVIDGRQQLTYRLRG